MKSYATLLIRTDDLDAVRQRYRSAQAVPGTPYVRAYYDRDAEPPDDEVINGDESLTLALSEQYGEAIYAYGDTSFDGFVYEHAQDGELLRKLVWFPLDDGGSFANGWVCVEGEPEAWEAALFRPDALDRLTYNERLRYQDEGMDNDWPEAEARIREHWAAGRITAGFSYPDCDGTAASLVERHYGVEGA